MRLGGFLSEMILKIDSENYGDKFVIERGKQFIYMVLKCSLYRDIISYLLFWRELLRNLESWRFQPNPYDLYVMNKVVYGKSCTVCWNVDDLKISHVESTLTGNILQHLEKKYRKVTLLTKL